MAKSILAALSAFLVLFAASSIGATAADWQARPGSSYKSPSEGAKSKGRNTLPDGHVATASRGDISKA